VSHSHGCNQGPPRARGPSITTYRAPSSPAS
jgi:hypothetical protein